MSGDIPNIDFGFEPLQVPKFRKGDLLTVQMPGEGDRVFIVSEHVPNGDGSFVVKIIADPIDPELEGFWAS